MMSAARTIDLAALVAIRDDLYHAAALCSALGLAMQGAGIVNGLPELVATIENDIDAAAEAVHVLTFSDGRAS